MQKRFFVDPMQGRSRAPAQAETFRDFDATELYCPKCQRATPVRKRLLLVLPEGDKYEYLCGFCATSVGTKVVKGGEQTHLVISS